MPSVKNIVSRVAIKGNVVVRIMFVECDCRAGIQQLDGEPNALLRFLWCEIEEQIQLAAFSESCWSKTSSR
jgi:hypothetical protein